jgi:hypothetical protein
MLHAFSYIVSIYINHVQLFTNIRWLWHPGRTAGSHYVGSAWNSPKTREKISPVKINIWVMLF